MNSEGILYYNVYIHNAIGNVILTSIVLNMLTQIAYIQSKDFAERCSLLTTVAMLNSWSCLTGDIQG